MNLKDKHTYFFSGVLFGASFAGVTALIFTFLPSNERKEVKKRRELKEKGGAGYEVNFEKTRLEVDVEFAEQLKAFGNEAYANKEFRKAIKFYDQAIQNAPNKEYISNRILSYLELQEYEKALIDSKILEYFYPNYAKGLHLRALTLDKLGYLGEAKLTLEHLASAHPHYKKAKLRLEDVEKRLTSSEKSSMYRKRGWETILEISSHEIQDLSMSNDANIRKIEALEEELVHASDCNIKMKREITMYAGRNLSEVKSHELHRLQLRLQESLARVTDELHNRFQCQICMDAMISCMIPCGHTFCEQCAKKCRPSCPYCKDGYSQYDIVKIIH